MDKAHIERHLIETIYEVQRLSGNATGEITEKTCPIFDLEAFDSLRGVETTVLLAIKLKCEFKATQGQVNVFVSKDARRPLRIKEIVNRLAELCA